MNALEIKLSRCNRRKIEHILSQECVTEKDVVELPLFLREAIQAWVDGFFYTEEYRHPSNLLVDALESLLL